MLLAPKGFRHYLRSHYLDQTFKGLYHWNAFDTAMLIPYFIVMIILAFYGIHRYQLVWLYLKNKKNAAKWDEPPMRFAEGQLPFVTIQLPIFNEQFVIDRLIDAVCKLDYPRDRFEIQVLDDSTDETTEVAREIVERYARGFAGMAPQPIVYLHRSNRHGYKAGALDKGLDVARGEFVAIFDADFVPPRQWVMQVIHHFAQPEIGMVQTRWTHLNRNYSFLTQVEAILLDGHFVLEHGGRSRAGVFFNFNGTAGMWRRETISTAGGWQHDTLTEDTDLSYRAQLVGWQFKYLQDVECPAELPIEMTAFKTQQARWAKGLIQTGKKILPRVLKSDAPWHTKLEAWYHLTANISYPLMIVLSVLLMPAMIIRSWQGLHSDAADRLSAVYREHDVGLYVLHGEPEGAVSEELVHVDPLRSVRDGAWRSWVDDHEHESRDGGAVRSEERVCTNAEVQGEEEGGEDSGEGVSQTARNCAVDRAGDWVLLCVDGLLCDHDREFLYGARSWCCSCSDTGTRGC